MAACIAVAPVTVSIDDHGELDFDEFDEERPDDEAKVEWLSVWTANNLNDVVLTCRLMP